MVKRATLLCAKEAAKEIGIDAKTLRAWVRENCGPPRLRIGKRFYYSTEMLGQWVKSLSLAS